MTKTKHKRERTIHRVADATDLTIDLMTLGQYGLEQVTTDAAGSEECGDAQRITWEAPRPRRRRSACEGDWRSGAPAWTEFACA